MLARCFRLAVVLAATQIVWSATTLSWAEEQPGKPQAGASVGAQARTAPAPLPMSAPPAAPWGYNYFVHPGGEGTVGAQLYVSPRPTPPLVGHTYVTYPPLAPHEFLYHHHRVYNTYNPGSGWTRTRARWR